MFYTQFGGDIRIVIAALAAIIIISIALIITCRKEQHDTISIITPYSCYKKGDVIYMGSDKRFSGNMGLVIKVEKRLKSGFTQYKVRPYNSIRTQTN